MSNPKLFVSYSWTTPVHEEWVIKLASDLRQDGVDVILDKWDLKEGHDANAFMEQMVTNPNITKVILICDRMYAEKANSRSGGVGAEAQIITPALFNRTDQDKFCAIVVEKYDDGSMCIPAYAASRIYIDFTDTGNFSDKYDQLLRWIFNRPLHEKPPIGKPPAFLSVDSAVQLATATRFRRALESIRSARPNMRGATSEYLETLSSEIEKFRINTETEGFDERFMDSLENFTPYRNEYIDLVRAIGRSDASLDFMQELHLFFESSAKYLFPPSGSNSYRRGEFDNLCFIVYELFLYTNTALIQARRFSQMNILLETEFYLKSEWSNNRGMTPYYGLQTDLPHFDAMNERQSTRMLSLVGHMVKKRCRDIAISFDEVMQTDLCLGLRAFRANRRWMWYPWTLVWAGRVYRPFEIFARASSLRQFNEVKVVLGVNDKGELEDLVNVFVQNPSMVPKWEFDGPDIPRLLGIEEIATKP